MWPSLLTGRVACDRDYRVIESAVAKGEQVLFDEVLLLEPTGTGGPDRDACESTVHKRISLSSSRTDSALRMPVGDQTSFGLHGDGVVKASLLRKPDVARNIRLRSRPCCTWSSRRSGTPSCLCLANWSARDDASSSESGLVPCGGSQPLRC